MNSTIMLAQTVSVPGGAIAVVGVLLGIMLLVIIAVILSRYTKVGPNQVLVVSGRKHRVTEPDGTTTVRGFRVVKGGGSFV